jgi:glycosyltransferase involved in cell wall biosynthesis
VRSVLAYTAAPGVGGAEISLGHLLAHAAPSIDITLAGTSQTVVTALSGCRPRMRALILPAGGARAFAAHVAAFRRLRPQIIHVNRHVPWAAATGIAAALATPATRLVTVDQLPLRTVDLVELWRTRALTLRADAPVAVGEACARRLEDFYALGRGSVRAVPNGVPDLDLRRRHRRADGPLVVGAVGRLDPMKGHDVLLRAITQVDRLVLVLVGSGPEEAALRALAQTLGVAERVTFTGWLSCARDVLPRFDVFAMPSRSEGFPLALIEAMLAELPCVATPVGSIGEAIRPERTGLLVPKDDPDALAAALRRLRDQPELADRLGSAARRAALQAFTVNTLTQAYEGLWAELVARPRTALVRPPPPLP